MFNPLACLSPRLQQGRAEEGEGEAEPGGGGGEEASRCSSTPTNPCPTMKKCNSEEGKKGSLSNCRVNNKKKNPYSTRGLDRFSILLADLEEKKRKIYAQVGSHRQDQEEDYYDVPYIQFIHSANSGDWVPIVIRVGDLHRYHRGTTQSQSHDHDHERKRKHKNGKGAIRGSDGDGKKDNKYPAQPQDGDYTSSGCTTMITATTTTSTPIKNKQHGSNSKPSSSSCPEILNQFQLQQQQQVLRQQRSKPLPYSADDGDGGRTGSTIHKKTRSSTEEKRSTTTRPSEYLPVVVLLSLVWLLMFGRSVAILLTSAWWYFVPTIKTPTRPHHRPIASPTVISSNSNSNSNPGGKNKYAKRPNKSSSFTRHKSGRSWGPSHRS